MGVDTTTVTDTMMAITTQEEDRTNITAIMKAGVIIIKTATWTDLRLAMEAHMRDAVIFAKTS